MNVKTSHLAILIIVATLAAVSCNEPNENWAEDAQQPDALHEAMQGITDVIVHDIFSPPQAARIYSYAALAAYETARFQDPTLVSAVGQLNDLASLPQPDAAADYSYDLAATVALIDLGRELTFSADKIDAVSDSLMRRFEAVNMPEEVFARSEAFGHEVASAVIAYSKTDNYAQSRTYPKYSVNDDPARWRPTPPDYMSGVEPHWGTMRPFVLDSASQCRPLPPPPYDMTPGSVFYEDVMEVYHALDTNETERRAIAAFWDCNPYVSHHQGHVMFATKKISPGGHWMGISKDVARAERLSTARSAETYLQVAVSLYDGFISCWDEKYRSNLVRPETVINELIDPEWLPLLQTPPFPEYTSGHSVISRAAAAALTDLFGPTYAYTDSVELRYGLPARSYDSFYAASDEAADSRLFGGIHYGPAIYEGIKQGEAVANVVRRKLKTRAETTGTAVSAKLD